ncbi:MAG: hypothetical protein AAGA54_32445, partial [Myxococcota bacterium]
ITKPPPTGPKVVLPFWFQFEDRVINNETGNLHGPRPKEQADVPFVLYGKEWGCNAVELNRDGTFACRFGGYTTLAGGWTYWTDIDKNDDAYFKALNRETGEVQIVQAPGEGKSCEVWHTAMLGPRVMLSCSTDPRMVIWSPTAVASYEAATRSNHSFKSHDHQLVSAAYNTRTEKTVPSLGRGWIDLAEMTYVLLPLNGNRDKLSEIHRGTWLITEDDSYPAWFATKIGSDVQRRVSGPMVFRKAEVLDQQGDDLLIGRWRGGPNPTRIVGFSPEKFLLFRLPGADNRESIITKTYVLSTTNGHMKLVSWKREPSWPNPSDE